MFINAYVIHDTKSAAYSNPWYQPTDATALRVISEVLKDGNNTIAKYPEDHRIYRIGQFDSDTGIFLALTTPLFIADCVSLLQPSSRLNVPDQSE